MIQGLPVFLVGNQYCDVHNNRFHGLISIGIISRFRSRFHFSIPPHSTVFLRAERLFPHCLGRSGFWNSQQNLTKPSSGERNVQVRRTGSGQGRSQRIHFGINRKTTSSVCQIQVKCSKVVLSLMEGEGRWVAGWSGLFCRPEVGPELCAVRMAVSTRDLISPVSLMMLLNS